MTRDAELLRSLDHFGHLDANQLRRLHFAGTKSRNSWDQVRNRLLEHGYIAHIGQRMVMGGKRGSGPTVYQLGIEGLRFVGKKPGGRARFTSVDEHRLKIADAFCELVALEAAGAVKILGYLCEPDTHMKLAGVTVRPDLYVAIQDIARGVELGLWCEIDRDKENRPQIEAKIRDYVRVFDDWTPGSNTRDVLDPLPRVVFLSDTDIGRHNLGGYLRGNTGEWGDMFVIDHIEGWAQRLI